MRPMGQFGALVAQSLPFGRERRAAGRDKLFLMHPGEGGADIRKVIGKRLCGHAGGGRGSHASPDMGSRTVICLIRPPERRLHPEGFCRGDTVATISRLWCRRLIKIYLVIDFTGAARGIRTPDPLITNEVLYQLSYCGAVRRRSIRPELICFLSATAALRNRAPVALPRA